MNMPYFLKFRTQRSLLHVAGVPAIPEHSRHTQNVRLGISRFEEWNT